MYIKTLVSYLIPIVYVLNYLNFNKLFFLIYFPGKVCIFLSDFRGIPVLDSLWFSS